jgi:hypothetical protein
VGASCYNKLPRFALLEGDVKRRKHVLNATKTLEHFRQKTSKLRVETPRLEGWNTTTGPSGGRKRPEIWMRGQALSSWLSQQALAVHACTDGSVWPAYKNKTTER